MFKIFRIVSACIAAALAGSAIFVGLYLDKIWLYLCLAGVLFFFVLCMFFKYLQESKEGVSDTALSNSFDTSSPQDDIESFNANEDVDCDETDANSKNAEDNQPNA